MKRNVYLQICKNCKTEWETKGGWNTNCPKCKSENVTLMSESILVRVENNVGRRKSI